MSSENFAAVEGLDQDSRRLLASFDFTAAQKREVWEAFKLNPDGVERCALQAKAYSQREGTSNGAGLLLTMLRRNDHLLEANPTAQRVTGWRWVAGAGHAAGSYVEDPHGVDLLPPGYDFTPSPRYDSTRYEPDREPIPESIADEVAKLAGRGSG